MLIFPGPEALSPFRLAKLQSLLTAKSVAVDSIHAEFVHFVHCSTELNEGDHALLKRLVLNWNEICSAEHKGLND